VKKSNSSMKKGSSCMKKGTFSHVKQNLFFHAGEKVKICRIWIQNTCFAVDGSLFNLPRTFYGQGQASYHVLNLREV
jgi:hypothetical protein